MHLIWSLEYNASLESVYFLSFFLFHFLLDDTSCAAL